MAILVTRPVPDGEKTAAALRARGHEALLSPTLRFEAVAFEDDGEAAFDAVILSSANAVRAVEHHAVLSRLLLLPVFAVGERTAEPLRAAGFSDITVAEGDAVSLVRLIRGTLAPGPTLLHVTARHHKEEPALSLRAAGFTILQWEAYEAQAVERLPDSAAAALRSGQIGAALHYSRRSADLFVRLADQAGLRAAILECPHVCLSADVAVPLQAIGASTRMAGQPNEDALLALLSGHP